MGRCCFFLAVHTAMGFLHLSVEYHAHKGTLKIRVWQVTDLLLPPPQTSMINTIYVRSYLIPDTPKKTNRRTEEVRAWEPEVRVKSLDSYPGTSVQHIFTPSSFRFSSPLIYTGVTSEIVQDRSIQIEVCMTQKFSKRSFLIGMVHMPLKIAVKKLLREKYPLIPCMNYTIPNNMKVYSACDLQLESSLGVQRSFSLREVSRSNGFIRPIVRRTVGDEELESVINGRNLCRDFVSIDVSNSSSDKESIDDLREVTVSNPSLASDSSTITISSTERDHTENEPVDQLEEVKVISQDGDHHVIEVHESDLNLPNLSSNAPQKPPRSLKLAKPRSHQMSNNQRLSECSDTSLEPDTGRGADTRVVDMPCVSPSPSPSRPETPCWDYYDLEHEAEESDDNDEEDLQNVPISMILDPNIRSQTSDHVPSHLHPSVVLQDEQEMC